jgi:hypothetical protein
MTGHSVAGRATFYSLAVFVTLYVGTWAVLAVGAKLEENREARRAARLVPLLGVVAPRSEHVS